ncbi:hypothetical protein JI58_02235 [Marinosulfonomonas sp. PRT-SC04]|nr:hypothetical protein JI58_02235 [Marinosulfonomonas sp. PRT-SC04]
MVLPPLTISPNIAPSSSTGSDAHRTQITHDFGGVVIGTSKTIGQRIAEGVAIAIIAGLAGKYILEKMK